MHQTYIPVSLYVTIIHIYMHMYKYITFILDLTPLCKYNVNVWEYKTISEF